MPRPTDLGGGALGAVRIGYCRHGLWVSHSRPAFSGHHEDSTVDNLVSKLIWTPPTWVVPGSTSRRAWHYQYICSGSARPTRRRAWHYHYILRIGTAKPMHRRAWDYHYIHLGSSRLYVNVIPSEN
jgi:hypothetical protein